jgi:hypothetical protein
MRRTVYFFLVIIFLASCGGRNNDQISTDVVNNPNTASGKGANNELPVIKFEQDMHDFGKVIQGEKVTYSFKFTNTGRADLLISSASASCGCTVPEYPGMPIRPNEQGVVKVSFNTEGRSGMQNKTVTLMANTQPNTYVLTIKAEVYKPEN